MKKALLFILVSLLLINASVSAYAAENAQSQGIKIYVNDTKIQFDAPPVFINNRTMVPIRAVFEAMGAIVEWNNDTKTATITGRKKVQVQLDNRQALVDGKPVIMEVPVAGMSGRILAPLRFIAEALEAEVHWVNLTQTAFINTFREQNHSGNIQNQGRFAADGEWNYYILQNHVLIRENSQSKKQEKISEHILRDLHIEPNWIYCIGLVQGTHKVIRLSKDGSVKQVIVNQPVNSMQIVNDWIYYGDTENETVLYRTKTDGTETMKLISNGDFSPKNWLVQNGWIYYPNYQTRKITRVRVDGSESSALMNLYVYSTSVTDNRSKNIETHYRIALIDDQYLYLVLENSGYDLSNYRTPGVYRIPLTGGNPQPILDKVPLSMNIDKDWLYMAVKKDGSSQLVKYKKDKTEVLTINEYKGSDIPGAIYINESSIFYTLHRGSNQEELLFRMNSEGENITPVLWVYGSDYSAVKSILSAATSAYASLNSFTLLQKVEREEQTVTNEHKINRSNALYSIRARDEKKNTIWEKWQDSTRIYLKSPDEKHWSISNVEKNSSDLRKTILDRIKPNEEFYNHLKLTGEGSKIILSGTSSFPYFMQSLMDSGELVYNTPSDFIDSATLEIVVNKDSMLAEELNLAINYYPKGEGNHIKQIRYKYTTSRMNDTDLSLPISVEQSVTAKKKAEFQIDEALQKLKEGKFQESIQLFDTAIGLYNKAQIAYLYKGHAQYYLGHYQEAILTLNQYYELMPTDIEVLSLQGMCYLKLGELIKAEQLADIVLKSNRQSILAINLKGSVAAAREEYREAFELFNKAVLLDSNYYESHFNLVSVLFNMGSYTNSIQTVDKFLQRFPEDRELLFIKARSLSNQGKSDEAIRVFEQVLARNPANDFVTMTYIAMEYEKLQNYTKAQAYADRAKAIYSDYNLLKHLLENLIYDRTTTSSQKLVDFIRENYLYYKETDQVTGVFNDIIAKLNDYTIKDVENLIAAVRSTEDTSTFILSGNDYEVWMNKHDSSSLDIRKEGDLIYFKLKTFTREIGIQFSEFIHSIQQPEGKTIVLDLRDNASEVSTEANTMLDALLPACTTSYLIERDGFITTFNSGKSHTRFNKIGILVNENTASSSELLALALRTYADNVTIIGKNTMGKGVGQIVYLDRNKKYAIFLVNHYWNVLQENIHDKGVPIDIKVGDDDPDYQKVLEKFLEGVK